MGDGPMVYVVELSIRVGDQRTRILRVEAPTLEDAVQLYREINPPMADISQPYYAWFPVTSTRLVRPLDTPNVVTVAEQRDIDREARSR